MEKNAVVFDGVWGIVTFPDDGRHFEYVFDGNLQVRPSDPSYVFTALQTIWPLPIQLDGPSEDALHVLGLATLETSEKAAFLTSYLALEHLIVQAPRSKTAKTLIARFQTQVERATRRKRSPLPDTEARSLSGALAALNQESFSSALMRFAGRVETPTAIKNIPVKRFFSACIKARNRIAHHTEPSTKVALPDLTAGLCEVVVGLILEPKQPSATLNYDASLRSHIPCRSAVYSRALAQVVICATGCIDPNRHLTPPMR